MTEIRLPHYQLNVGELYWKIMTSKCEEISLQTAEKLGIIRITYDDSESGGPRWSVTIEIVKPSEIKYFIEESIDSEGNIERKLWTPAEAIHEYSIERGEVKK